jgi:hypothetical protein
MCGCAREALRSLSHWLPSLTPPCSLLAANALQAHVHAGGQPPRCAVIMVEMERWDRCVLYGVKSYSVVPATATWCVADAEVCSESPVELKHRKLSRSLHRTLVDRNLQPDSQERRHIQVLEPVGSPFTLSFVLLGCGKSCECLRDAGDACACARVEGGSRGYSRRRGTGPT